MRIAGIIISIFSLIFCITFIVIRFKGKKRELMMFDNAVICITIGYIILLITCIFCDI